LIDLNEWLCYNIPPGPVFIPLHVIVNITKGTMMLYLFALMCYFDNFSTGAWIYLSLHGNYGFIWYLKDKTFPNPGFVREATFISGVFTPMIILVPYYYIGYWMMSGTEDYQRNPSMERCFIAI